MIQPIYTSVNNADIVPCGKKGFIVKSEPIPLLRDNYLGEYRTQLEKAKVRKNLGIADEQSLLWGNISGTIEAQKDLVQYIEQKWKYSSDLVQNINTVKEAIDYALRFISQYEANTEEIAALRQEFEQVKSAVSEFETNIQEQLNTHTTNIETIQSSIEEINQSISNLNSAIENIDVDQNILNWITTNLQESATIKIGEAIEVKVSEEDGNAVQVNNGVYVKDLQPELDETNSQILTINQTQEELSSKVDQNTQNITTIQSDLEVVSTYQTELPNETISTVVQGTTVEQLKGKSFTEIIDTLIFPTSVRELVQPQLFYSSISSIVEVGSEFQIPTLTFIKNDAGEETNRVETVTYNNQEVESYSNIGVYSYLATVSYNAGEYLIDNKGQVTDKRIEAGQISTSVLVTATYPWYAGNTSDITKQSLVAFGSSSGVIDFSLSGKAVIKLPGQNTTLDSFLVDGGLGYLNVDLNGWSTSTEMINNYPYKVWTKNDTYSSVLPHKITFTLKQ